MASRDIIVVGSLNLDIVIRVPRLPTAGETVVGQDLLLTDGGKGANQAAAAARLGAAVHMVGRVGRDTFGSRLIESLRGDGVDTSHVGALEGPSGMAIVLLDEQGRNQIAVAPGANDGLDGDGVSRALDDLAEARLLVLQCEIPAAAIRQAIEAARKADIPVLLNTAPVTRCPIDLLGDVHCVVANEVESSQITGLSVTGVDSAMAALDRLLRLGPQQAVITLGALGAVGGDHSTRVHVPSSTVQVVDTTGAGDAFVGAMAVATVARAPFQEMLQFSTLVGTMATTRVGARVSFPSRGDVLSFRSLADNPRRFGWLDGAIPDE